MKRWLTTDDFIEAYTKLQQRGGSYLFSKFNPSSTKRTQSTFGESSFQHANWWIIPAVRRRWNERITGNPEKIYEDYFVEKYLKGQSGLRMLSLGCGIGSHERNLARHRDTFQQIDAYDIAPNLIQRANAIADAEGLSNIQFHCADVNQLPLEEQAYDLIFFHSSIHHFLHLDHLMGTLLPRALKADGYLLLNDYWGPDRLQWSPAQIREVNRLLQIIPKEKRRRFRSRLYKSSVSGPGWLRMRLSDPSEAAEASQIQPLLRKHYQTLEETPIGGSILMPLLKDIAHHFVEDSSENQTILQELFAAEDQFLEGEPSLLFFGVYRPK
jgi:ubiquinone/menaquinone biosynthesis C-methylase UbiE